MINESTWYIAACDICGEELDDGDGGGYFPKPAGALDYARDLGCWWIGAGENPAVICDSRNEEHMTRAREIAAALRSDGERGAFRLMWPEIDLTEHEPRFAAVMPGQTVIPTAA